MQYLAEVIQKKGGIIGGNKVELKLLACQRGEQNWQAISEETIAGPEETNRYNSGILLLVELTASRQVQRIQEATRPLVGILQNFSRLQERFKTQEQEIEQWKQSLTYQSQELNSRELELEARQAECQQLDANLAQLEQQRQEFAANKQEVLNQQQALAAQRQELEGAWQQLQGQQQRLEERQAELLGSAGLDQEKAQFLHELLNHLAAGKEEASGLDLLLQEGIVLIGQQQEIFNFHWQNFEQHQQDTHQHQQDLEHQLRTLEQRRQEWHEQQAVLEKLKAEAISQETTLQARQTDIQTIAGYVQAYDDLHQDLYRLVYGGEVSTSLVQIDIAALEKKTLEELQTLIQELEQDFERSAQFVHSQEEELTAKQKELEEFKHRIMQANEFDRIGLETELADEQDAYQFLHETLVGQRRKLQEKKDLIEQHQSFMARRQGTLSLTNEDGAGLEPILIQIDAQRRHQQELRQQLIAEVEQLQYSSQQIREQLDSRVAEQEGNRQELEQAEQRLQEQRSLLAAILAKVEVYQVFLSPAQEKLTLIQQHLEKVNHTVLAGAESANESQTTIEQIRQVIDDLAQNPLPSGV